LAIKLPMIDVIFATVLMDIALIQKEIVRSRA